ACSSTIILDDQIGCFAWAILTKVNSLRREVYGFIRANCFILGKILLTACDRPFQCSFETAIDPDRNVEMMAIPRLKQEDTFKNNDIYVFKGVRLAAVCRCRLFSEVHHSAVGSLPLKRKNQLFQHFIHP